MTTMTTATAAGMVTGMAAIGIASGRDAAIATIIGMTAAIAVSAGRIDETAIATTTTDSVAGTP